MNKNSLPYLRPIQVAYGFVVMFSLLVIIGWIFEIPELKSVIPHYNSMKFNTALAFILTTISIYFQISEAKSQAVFLWKSIGAVVLIIGVMSFVEEMMNVELGIDQLLFIDQDAIVKQQPAPGRMAAASSFCFIMLGLFSLTVNVKNKLIQVITQVLLHIVTLISFISIIGYLLGVPSFYRLSFITSMAIHTSLCFFIISISSALIHHSIGLTALFTGNRVGNILARKLFVQITISVLLLSYFRVLSHRYNFVGVEFGIALFALSFILVSLFLIWKTANGLNLIEVQKIQVEHSLQQTSSILDATPDPMIIINADGKIMLSNNQTEIVFGYSKADIIGKKVTLLIPHLFMQKQEGFRNDFVNLPSTGALGTAQELFATKKTGEELSVEVSLKPILIDGHQWVSLGIRDVTERKNNEKAYVEISERLNLATDISGIGVWDFDIVKNKLIWNDKLYELYGVKKEDFAGVYEAWKACLHPDDLKRTNREVDASIKGQKDFDTEFRVIWPNGSIHYIRARAAVYRDSEGNAVRMLGTNWDATNLKIAELELVESNKRNAIFIREAPNAIAMFDKEMRYMAASKKWLTDYHLEAVEIIGRSHYDIFPEIGDDWKAIHRECLAGNINQCDEAYFQRADGSAQWITWDVRPWYISIGEIGGLIMYTAEITEAKQRDADKRRIEEILDKTNEVARIGTWEVDLVNNEVNWSRVTKEIHEVSPWYKPDLETAINFFKEGESRETIHMAVAKAIEQGATYDLEVELVTYKGNIKWARAIGQAEFQNGKCKRLYGVFQDIDEIKKSRESLTKMNLELQAIFNSGYVSIIGTDNNGLITHFNSGAEMLLQYSAAEMIGNHTPAILHVPEEALIRSRQLSEIYGRDISGFEVFVSVAQDGKHESREWTYVRKDGSTFPVQLIVTSIKNEKDEITGFLGIATDITERKQLEEKLRNYSILESKSKEMEQFAYVASHDLREPLLTIKNYIEILEEDYGGSLDIGGKRYIAAIFKASNRMDELIKGLLDYSRLSIKKQLQDVDCNELVDAVLTDLNSIITTSGAIITVDVLPILKAYPLELKLLFQNLITNAIKFVKKGTIPAVKITCHPFAEGWQFEVKDNGIGIVESDKEKIFNMFQRLHSKAEYEGTGIGLAHCRKIVELHHGTIWVDSTPGASSTFYFTILN